jgi:ABC-type sugar transport system substrate-binding protein
MLRPAGERCCAHGLGFKRVSAFDVSTRAQALHLDVSSQLHICLVCFHLLSQRSRTSSESPNTIACGPPHTTHHFVVRTSYTASATMSAEQQVNLTDLEPIQLQEVKKQLDSVRAPPALLPVSDSAASAVVSSVAEPKVQRARASPGIVIAHTSRNSNTSLPHTRSSNRHKRNSDHV